MCVDVIRRVVEYDGAQSLDIGRCEVAIQLLNSTICSRDEFVCALVILGAQLCIYFALRVLQMFFFYW